MSQSDSSESQNNNFDASSFCLKEKYIKAPQVTPRRRNDVGRITFDPKKQINSFEKEKNRHKQHVGGLKKTMLKKKAQDLTNNFLSKLRLNSVNREPVNEENLVNGEEERKTTCYSSFQDFLRGKKGIKMGSTALVIWSFLNLLHIICMVAVFSIMLAFPEIEESQGLMNIRTTSIMLFILDLVLNLTIERYEDGKLLKNLLQIWRYYIESDFLVDVLSIAGYSLDLALNTNLSVLLTIISLVKFFVNKKELEKFEYMYVDSKTKEKYFGLVKVILTNFAIGHVLSILLNMMALISYGNSWWMKLNIAKADWLVKYIWGYYWGTNIMLTVGFGDISANNYYEALVLIFIETFSCITLAYNISYVGALLSQFRQREEEKKKKLKFFHKMCKENQISEQLQSKVTNLIKQSYEIKETFCYEEYDEVLNSLQKKVQIQYKKQANKMVFDGLGFLSNLTEKSLMKLAEVIQRKICYPEELIYKKGSKAQLSILQKGSLYFACKRGDKKLALNGRIIDKLSVNQKQKAKMLTLDFIKSKPLNFDIKSEGYSILYTLDLEKFREALKYSDMDYQLYCVLKDRQEYILDTEHLHPCDLCEGKNHSKFECPKIHYIPLRQMVILKYLHREKTTKNKRTRFIREKIQMNPLLGCLQDLKEDQMQLLKNYLSEQEWMQASINQTIKQKSNLPNEESMSIELNYDALAREISKVGYKRTDDDEENKNTIFNWDIECDEVKNYNHYFRKFNVEKFEIDRKLSFKKSFFSKLSTIKSR